MLILSEYIYRFSSIAIKKSSNIFIDIDKIILKIYIKNKGIRAETIMKTNNIGEGISLHSFKIYYMAIIIKTVCYWQRGTHT